MEPFQPSSILPWYIAVLWGVVIVVGAYALLLLLAALFPVARRRLHRQHLEPFRRKEMRDLAETKQK
jgi:hypothetical protein